VPISVSAFSEDDIAKLQLITVGDIAANVPNLQTYAVTSNATAIQVYMRGAGVSNPGFNASESPVGFYVDDVYRGRLATANLDLTDIERIEVLRGPQGTLYGRNTIAGAVKIITRTPTDTTYGNAQLGIGNFDTYRASGSIGGQVLEGLGASIAGSYNERGEGWIKRGSTGGRALGEYENKALRGKLNWFGGEVFSATLTGEYIDAENDGYNAIPYGPSFNPASSPGAPLEGFYDSLVPDETVGFGRGKQKNATLKMEWDLSSVTLTSISGYSDVDDRFGFDLNGGAFQVTPMFIATGGAGLFVNSASDNQTFSQEFNIAGATDSFDWIAGVFYMNEEGKQDYRIKLDANAADPTMPIFLFDGLVENSATETESYAIYGEGTWAITDKFSATVGVRWTYDDKEYTNSCNGIFCTRLGGAPGSWDIDLDNTFNEFTPRILLQYQATDNTMIFGGVSRGFQAGGFQTLCFGNKGCNRVVYQPQRVVSWVTGIKTELLDNKIRINASTFLAQYDNLQQTAIDTASGSFPAQNVGGVDVYGLEVEAYYAPTDNWNLFAIIGLADEEFDSATSAQLPFTSRLPGLPRQTVRLGFDYERQAFADWDLIVGLDLNYVSDYFATINNAAEVGGYTRWNGRIGMQQADGPWSVVLNGLNIGDGENLVSAIAGNGTNIRTPAPPREYILNFNYRY
jgi:iron complex outermembrane receptor protein